jgi:hypothetical protein
MTTRGWDCRDSWDSWDWLDGIMQNAEKRMQLVRRPTGLGVVIVISSPML